MSDLVKNVLGQIMETLKLEHVSIKRKIDETFEQEVRSTLESIRPLSPYVKTLNIEIRREKIKITLDSGSWSGIEIEKPYEWRCDNGGEEYKWDNSKVILGTTSSNSNKSEKDLIFNIVLGEISKIYLNKDVEWNRLCGILEEMDLQYKDQLDPYKEKFNDISKSLDEIKIKERDELFNSIMKKGFIEFEENTRYYYGNGKYDYGFGNYFCWEINKSGKTAILKVKTKDGFEIVREREKIGNIQRFVKHNSTKSI